VPAVSEPSTTRGRDQGRSTGGTRRFYADFGDRLRSASPGAYALLRAARRALARLLRHPGILLLAVAVLAALLVAGAVSSAGWRYLFWTTAALLVVLFAVASVAAYAYQAAQQQSATARRLRDLSKQTSAAAGKTDARVGDLARRLDGVPTAKRLERTISDLERRDVELERRLAKSDTTWQGRHDELAAALERINTSGAFSNYENARGLRMHTRRLTQKDLERLRTHWLKTLGLTLSDRELRYLAHKICLDEERCEGRLATTVQAAMLRALALLSVDSDEIEVLEIGTLCGIAAGSLYRTGLRAQRSVQLTLIDPLSGYYGERLVDGQTGVAITPATVVANLAALDVEPDHYRIIQRKSTDPEAIAAASDRQYDFVLIDGDHSLAGVSNDYELYGGLVKPGGILIFDDYGTEDWPAIQPYVDEHVRSGDEWLWIGGEWRTGILQRKPTPVA